MDSKVYIRTKFTGKKTINQDVYFTPPYKIIAPLYNENEAEIVLLSSSAGLLKGDNIDMEFYFDENSNVKITSQSYEKVFDTLDGQVNRNIKIDVLENATVKFMPYPTIPFKNSSYKSTTTVNLKKNSEFCYLDIFSCGRVCSSEYFEMKWFSNYVLINVEGKPVFIDNTLIDPKKWNYKSIGLWHEYTHNGFMYIYPKKNGLIPRILEEAQQKLSDFEFGASECAEGLCVRVLGNSGDRIFKFFEAVSKIV